MNNEITINGDKFTWRVYEYYPVNDYRGNIPITEFYQKEKVKRKKYYLFGPEIEKTENVIQFTVQSDITDPEYSKEHIRELIGEEYDKWKKITNRKREIEKGEII